jgi:hypothetical protein
MKEVFSYNIHDLLKFRIVRDKKRDFLKDLNLEFSFFEDKDVDNHDITLNIGGFIPSNNDCYLVDHKYHIKRNYLYCKDYGRGAKWEIEIFGFEDGPTTINYQGRVFGPEVLFPDRLPQDIILQPLIEYKLCKKGFLLIHSAAVSNNNTGYILVGRPNAFKSTLTMDFVRKAGFSWLGEDRVIIYRDKILSFPISPKTFSFKCRYLPNEDFRGFLDKIRFVKYLRRHNTDSESYNDSIAESSVLKSLLFIARTNKKVIKRRSVNLDEAVDKLFNNNQAEMMLSHFYKYMLAYSFVFPNSKIAVYWEELRKKLEEILRQISIYEIEIPEKYDQNVFKKVYNFMR